MPGSRRCWARAGFVDYLLWTVCNFLSEDGEERTEKLTKRAVDDGLGVSALWGMLSAHVQAQFYAPITPDDEDEDVSGDLLARVAKENAGKVRPLVPIWLLPGNRQEGT